MKRFWAAAVDFVLGFILSMVLFCLIISCWKSLRIWMGVDWRSNVSFSVMVMLFLILFLLVSFLYSVFFDYVFKGKTLGKKLVGFRACPDMEIKSSKWMIKHALVRTVASLFYVITASYYLVTNKMIYDEVIGNRR
ncbi:MAG: RDD family protein [Lachnospiraceae bacterium]|nr:RDD family protein [Lachnospiraceae bacterium]